MTSVCVCGTCVSAGCVSPWGVSVRCMSSVIYLHVSSVCICGAHVSAGSVWLCVCERERETFVCGVCVSYMCVYGGVHVSAYVASFRR